MKRLIQWFLTCALAATTVVVLLVRYEDYLIKPWTRDGQVQADIITVASRVTGPVVFIGFKDNQYIEKGALLYSIDKSTFIAAKNLAKAKYEESVANALEALDQYKRAEKVVQEDPDAISRQALLQYEYAWQASEAEKRSTEAALKEAELNLQYTDVYAPVAGYVTNYSLYMGTMSVADTALISLVDPASFWIYGYFKETDVANIKRGDRAEVTLMGYPETPVEGVVESIGWGIAQMNTSLDRELLPEVSPTFEWIRLAQRIPVRITLTEIPKDIVLRVGMTASILVDTVFRGEMREDKGELRRRVLGITN